MGTTRRGGSDLGSRAARSQRKSEAHESGHFEFRCDICGFVLAQAEMRVQHGQRVCSSCFEPHGDEVDREIRRAWASKRAAAREAQRRLPKYPFSLETVPAIIEIPEVSVESPHPLSGEPVGPDVTFRVEGLDLDDVTFIFPADVGLLVLDTTTSSDEFVAVLAAESSATPGCYPVLAQTANGVSTYWAKIKIWEGAAP